jgi:hypothetical protein
MDCTRECQALTTSGANNLSLEVYVMLIFYFMNLFEQLDQIFQFNIYIYIFITKEFQF